MSDNEISKLAKIADAFLDASGLPLTKTAFGKKVNNALTDEEQDMLGSIFLGALGDALSDDKLNVDRGTLKLAEMFAKVAQRISAEDEAASYIPVAMTTDGTLDELNRAGASTLAKIVTIAREKKL